MRDIGQAQKAYTRAGNMDIDSAGGEIRVRRSALLRTARKLMDGQVFIPGGIWPTR